MSLVGLVNLAERLLNQSDNQGQDAEAAQKTANQQVNQESQGAAEDQFTPSTQNGQVQATAQDAGLFNVSQFSFFSAAADFLLAQTRPADAAATAGPNALSGANGGGATAVPQNAFAAPQIGFAAATAPQGVAAAPGAVGLLQGLGNGNANAPNSNGLNAQAAAPPAALPAANAGTNNATGALGSQQQIQALNNALAALGLDPQQIQELDQIASIIKDFNPAAYTALAYQLEELAQQTQQAAATPANGAAQGAAANPAAANGTTAVANTNVGNVGAANAVAGTNANAGGAAANGGFQVQELVIRFTGVEAQVAAPANGNAAATGQAAPPNGNAAATGSAAAPNGKGNTNLQVASFNLQIEEVNLTLVDGNGQTAQIQTPAANTNPLTTTNARAVGA